MVKKGSHARVSLLAVQNAVNPAEKTTYFFPKPPFLSARKTRSPSCSVLPTRRVFKVQLGAVQDASRRTEGSLRRTPCTLDLSRPHPCVCKGLGAFFDILLVGPCRLPKKASEKMILSGAVCGAPQSSANILRRSSSSPCVSHSSAT